LSGFSPDHPRIFIGYEDDFLFFSKLIFLLKWKNIKIGLANVKELNVCYSNPKALRILTSVDYFILFFFFPKNCP
jgi:hypothetical protein